MDFATTRKKAKDILVSKIPPAIAHLKRPLTLVVLYWFFESHLTDVVTLAGFRYESERLKMIDANEMEAYWYGEGDLNIELNEDEESIIRSYLHEAIDKQDWFAFRDLLREVAAELTRTKFQWSRGLVDVTDDFVVYALEGRTVSGSFEDLDFGEALLASVDAAQIDSWKTLGYLNHSIL